MVARSLAQPLQEGGTATPRGLLVGAGRRLGWALDGASVLEDGLVGLVHVLGHLWCSTLQGQLQGEREVRGWRGLQTPRAPLWGWEGTQGATRAREPDGRVWCAHVAWRRRGWGRCVVKRRGRLLRPAGRRPNILAAHTPAVSPATAALAASSVNHERAAGGEGPAPAPQSCWGWGVPGSLPGFRHEALPL